MSARIDERVVLLEVRSQPGEFLEGLSVDEVRAKMLQVSGDYIDKIATTITDFSSGLLSRVTKAGGPSKVKVEFGVNAGGSAGIPFVTEGNANAHVTVSVEWELKG